MAKHKIQKSNTYIFVEICQNIGALISLKLADVMLHLTNIRIACNQQCLCIPAEFINFACLFGCREEHILSIINSRIRIKLSCFNFASLPKCLPLNLNPIQQFFQITHLAHFCTSQPSISATIASISLRNWSILLTVVFSSAFSSPISIISRLSFAST